MERQFPNISQALVFSPTPTSRGLGGAKLGPDVLKPSGRHLRVDIIGSQLRRLPIWQVRVGTLLQLERRRGFALREPIKPAAALRRHLEGRSL
jgi:hypothetical protein